MVTSTNSTGIDQSQVICLGVLNPCLFSNGNKQRIGGKHRPLFEHDIVWPQKRIFLWIRTHPQPWFDPIRGLCHSLPPGSLPQTVPWATQVRGLHSFLKEILKNKNKSGGFCTVLISREWARTILSFERQSNDQKWRNFNSNKNENKPKETVSDQH